jgi:dephospho-CoA kinase
MKLLITGMMGSGKGFTAQYLADNHSAVRWSRTELMKRLAHAVVDRVGDPDQLLKRIFDDPYLREEVGEKLFEYGESYLPEPGKPRRLYQDITEICQDYDPLCFEIELEKRIQQVGNVDFSLIDDVRSLAAFEYFTEAGYSSLRVEAKEEIRKQRMLERDGYLPPEDTFTHSSEIELNNIPHDFVLDNNKQDLSEFYNNLERIYQQLLLKEK